MTDARVFLTHQTAFQYWARRDVGRTTQTRCVPLATNTPTRAHILDARHFVLGIDDSETIHAAVYSKSAVRAMDGAVLHTRNVPYPRGSFRQVSGDVFVASPELCFLQAASILSFEALVMYGFELCGTYARTGDSSATRYGREPLTSVRKITAYLERSQGVTGVKEAKRAAAYLVDGSASPRESALVAMMTLPPRLGGFGLPKPELNYEIEVDLPDKISPGERLRLHGDTVWPEASLVVEYDGAQHGLIDNHASDKQRDHVMLDAGYEVVRITDKQLRDAAEIERLAQTIRRKSKLKRGKASFQTDSRKLKTQHALLWESGLPWVGRSEG